MSHSRICVGPSAHSVCCGPRSVAAILVLISSAAAAQPVVYEESQTGGNGGSTIVTTAANLSAESANLYVAAVSSKPNQSVESVSGLGLDWVRVDAQCAGRGQTGVELWAAQGVPGAAGAVSATFSAAPQNAAIVVSRYSGVDGAEPIGSLVSANSNGLDGVCAGGNDSSSYSLDITTHAVDSVVYTAAAMRNRGVTPGAGYTERVEFAHGSGGSVASVATADGVAGPPATVTADGYFDGTVDWAAIALEIKPAGSSVPAPRISVNPSSHDYGAVLLGESVNQTYQIRNDGNVDLHVDAPAFSGGQFAEFGFVSGGESFALSPGAFHDIVVRYTPSLLGESSSTLALASDDPEQPAFGIALIGTGVDTEPPPVPIGDVTLEEYEVGGASAAAIVSSAALAGVEAQLYIAAVSSKPYRSVSSVDGLGLDWVPVVAQCSGRSQAGVDIWAGWGAPTGDGAITASFSSAADNAAIAVARYSGVDTDNPLGQVVSGNTNGVNGGCAGGTDTNSYAIGLTTDTAGAVIFGAASMRNRAHTPGAAYTEHVEYVQGSGGAAASLAIVDGAVPAPAPVLLDGSFSGSVDWAAAGIEIRPAGTSVPSPDIGVAPAGRDFGQVAAGWTVTQEFLVRNNGTLDLAVDTTNLIGEDAEYFGILSGWAPFVLAPGQAHSLIVKFTAESERGFQASLLIESNDPDESRIELPLSATSISYDPDIAVTPLGYDFGEVVLTQSAEFLLSIGNGGASNLEVTDISLRGVRAPEFEMSAESTPFVLESNAARDILVRVKPTATGEISATLEIASNDPDEPLTVVTLMATGIDIPYQPPADVLLEQVETGGSSDSSMASTSGSLSASAGDLYLAAVSSKPYREVVSVTGLGLDWFPVEAQCAGRNQTGLTVWAAYGSPTVDDVVAATIASAASNLALTVSRFSGVDALNPIGSTSRANSNGPDGACSGGTDGAAYAFALSTTDFESVVYAATAMRNRTHTPGTGFIERIETMQGGGGSAASIAVQDMIAASPQSVTVDGRFNGSVDWAAVGIEIRRAGSSYPVPDVVVDPREFDYGPALIATQLSRTFTIRNDGNADLLGYDVALDGPDAGEFRIVSGGGAFFVQPGENRDVSVDFVPASVGSKSAVLRIESNDPNEATYDVALSGNAVDTEEPDIGIDPSSHDFGSTVLGSGRTTLIEIRNNGLLNLSVASTEFTGFDTSVFSIVSGGGPFTLGPGEAQDLLVRFAPTAEGPAQATLQIVSNDLDEPQVNVLLSGQGSTIAEGIWISADELASKPMSGTAWEAVQTAADAALGTPDIGNSTSNHDVRTLAVALVYARTGDSTYRQRARDAIMSAIGTESSALESLQPCRNVFAYVISADLIRMGEFEPVADASFREWIDAMRYTLWPDGSMISEDAARANNRGRMCGMSRAAIALYLGDEVDLEQTATIFAGFLGDTGAYNGFRFTNDLSWQADEANPVGVNPVGAIKDGLSIDGALPEDMRRGGPFQIPPLPTGYPWEAVQGIVAEAIILNRAGYDVFEWSDRAILRMIEYLGELDSLYPGDSWWANGDDTWIPWVINAVYGTTYPTEPANIGKAMGWTDWTHAP